MHLLNVLLLLFCSLVHSYLPHDPSQDLSTQGSLHRVTSVVTSTLLACGLGSPAALQGLGPALKQHVFTGNATLLYPLGLPTGYYLRVDSASTPLGALLRSLRCDVGWGEGCNEGLEGVLLPPTHPMTPQSHPPSSLESTLVEANELTQRLKAALWMHRMEYCDLVDLLAPTALTVMATATAAAAGPPPSLPPRAIHSEFVGFLGAPSTLGSCALRRLRNGGGKLAGVVTSQGSTVHTTQEALLQVLLGGSTRDALDAQHRDAPCLVLEGFRSAVVDFVEGRGVSGEQGGEEERVAPPPLPTTLTAATPSFSVPPPPPPSPPPSSHPPHQGGGGLHVFTSMDDLEGLFGAPSPYPITPQQLPTATPSPTPPPSTLWHALLEDLQKLRKTAAPSVVNEGYFTALLTVTRPITAADDGGGGGNPTASAEVNIKGAAANSPNDSTYTIPAWLPSCTQDQGARAMLKALVQACAHAPPPDARLAESLAKESGRLLLAVLLAGDGEDFDATRCILHMQASQQQQQQKQQQSSPPPPPLFLCLPTSPLAPILCPPPVVWASPRDELVPWWGDLSSTSATLLLTHPRVASYLQALLHYALAVGDIAGWHPSGISPPDSPELNFSPQHMFYFASSYFFVHLEAEYKRQLHRRLNSALARLKVYSNTQGILGDASAWRKRMRGFHFPRDARRAGLALGVLARGGDSDTVSQALLAMVTEERGKEGEEGKGVNTTTTTRYIFPEYTLLAPPCADPLTPRLLVFSSYWDRGHSSHRITAPLSKALTQHTCAYLAHAVSEDVWEATRFLGGEEGGAGAPSASPYPMNASRAVELLAGARNRYEEPAGFADVEVFPVTENLPVQLALWSHFRSTSQMNGVTLPSLYLPSTNISVDATFAADMSEWDGTSSGGGGGGGGGGRGGEGGEEGGGGGGGGRSPAQPPLPFDAVLYPSVGMSPNDMTLSSLRVATTQMVTYGHSSSSRSPVMDVFLGGVEPEVLGPLTSDIYALEVNCIPSLDALYGLLRVALHPMPTDQQQGQQVVGLVGGWAPNSPLRLPMVGVCDGEALIGNATHPNTQLGSYCALMDKSYFVSTGGALGEVAFERLLATQPSLFLPPSSTPLSPRCKTSFPTTTPTAHALYTRLVDAQRRYSERLVLLPGLGLWFTHVFPTYAPPLRVMPTLGGIPHATLALRMGAGILGYLMGGRSGAMDGGLEARSAASHALLLATADAHYPLTALLNESLSAIPWPGSSPFDPITISLVWSVVKWNGRHLDRLLVAMHTAQTLWAGAWCGCVKVVEACGSEVGGGEDTAQRLASLGYSWWVNPEEEGVVWENSSPLAAFSATATCTLCKAVLEKFPPRISSPPPAEVRPPPLLNATSNPPTPPSSMIAPPLFIRILSFSTHDGDVLKGAAFRSWVRRTLAAEFPGGTAAAQFVTNATTPATYYGALGRTALAFDSLPFSACNTMQDVVALRVPTVSASHDGEFEPGSGSPLRWRSGIGASMLTRLGLSGLGARGEEELHGKASHLIANPLLRAAWKVRMDGADEGELARKQYADRDAQLVALMLKRRKAEMEERERSASSSPV